MRFLKDRNPGFLMGICREVYFAYAGPTVWAKVIAFGYKIKRSIPFRFFFFFVIVCCCSYSAEK